MTILGNETTSGRRTLQPEEAGPQRFTNSIVGPEAGLKLLEGTAEMMVSDSAFTPRILNKNQSASRL